MVLITKCMKVGNFSWSDEAMATFEVIKVKLTTALVLALPKFSQPFELQCDASKVGVRAVLSQGGRSVVYFKEKLSG